MCCSKSPCQNSLSACSKTLILPRYKELMTIQQTKNPSPQKPEDICFTVPDCFTDLTDCADVSCKSRSRQINEHILIMFALGIAGRNTKWYDKINIKVNFYFSYASDSFLWVTRAQTQTGRKPESFIQKKHAALIHFSKA